MTVSEKIKIDKTLIKDKRFKRVIKSFFFFALGFLFSIGRVTGELHPFGTAIVAVSKKKYFLFTAAGALLGSLVYGLNVYSARYLCAVSVAALGAFAAAAFNLNYRPAFSMSIAFAASLTTGIILCLRLEATIAQYVLTAGEAILCCGGAFFFYRALSADYRRFRFRALPIADSTCALISLSLLLMNLSSLKIGFLSPAVILATGAILTAVRFFGERQGVILALCFGFAIGIANENTLFIIGAFAFSAMVSALFSPLSTLGIGSAFLCCSAFFSIASGYEYALPFFCDTGLGVLLFMLLPSRLVYRLDDLSQAAQPTAGDGSLRQTLVLKLRFASSAMAAISDSVEQVREKINEITRKENESRRDTISEEEYIQRELVLEKTNQIRMVASDQFFSIADMLEDLAFEFDEAEIFDASASSKIRRLLSEYEIYPVNISAIEDKYGRMRVEILMDGSSPALTDPKLAKEIGKICSRYFDTGKITHFKNETMLSFSEKPNYKLHIGFAQYSAEGHLCGDTVKIINDNKGHSILIISDGMGTGSRAALDGAMGAGLLSKLLNAGFGFDSALKVVNCALLVKSNDESLATLDIANIDLFTGKCEIFKAGAPASYIIKENDITKCELTSMPAGILRGIEFAKRTAVLSLEDTVVLMSDGISDLGEEWLNLQLQDAQALPAQEFAQYILDEALTAYQDKRTDDMSIIVAKLERNG